VRNTGQLVLEVPPDTVSITPIDLDCMPFCPLGAETAQLLLLRAARDRPLADLRGGRHASMNRQQWTGR
jgi:hypothetical protein